MKNDNRKYYSIDTVVRTICDLRGDPESARYTSVARTVMVALDQLNLYIIPNVKSEFLTVADNLTITMDDRWIDVTKVGVVQNNCLIILPYDEELVHTAYTESTNNGYWKCDCENTGQLSSTDLTASCAKCTFHNVWFGNRLIGEAYGANASAKEYGTWKFDYKTNTIVFNSGIYLKAGTKVLVERKPTLSNSELQLIPTIYFPVIMQRVNQWLDQKVDPTSSQLAFDQFLREYEQLKQRHFEKWTLEDYVDSLRSNYSPAARFG